MQINEVLQSTIQSSPYCAIKDRCSRFIYESNGLPLMKLLPRKYNDVHRVKVRKRKLHGEFDSIFNETFEHETFDIRQRSIFARSVLSENTQTHENFYVFPIDGYRFMYNKEVDQSEEKYKKVFEQLNNDDIGVDLLSELLRFTYSNKNLYEGIYSGAEIILYNVPFYYAVRVSSVDSYKNLLKSLKK